MIKARVALELEGYHKNNGQIQVVRDYGLRVDGYTLYLRYENEKGDALAKWLYDHPDRHVLVRAGQLLATIYAIPLDDLTPEALAA